VDLAGGGQVRSRSRGIERRWRRGTQGSGVANSFVAAAGGKPGIAHESVEVALSRRDPTRPFSRRANPMNIPALSDAAMRIAPLDRSSDYQEFLRIVG